MARSKSQNISPVGPQMAKTLLKRCFSQQKPAMLWGPPGIGKSDIMQSIGDDQNRRVVDLRLLLMEPTDLKGIPFYNPESKTMEWATPSELPREDGPFSDAILFLDEINAAPPSIQAAAYQLVLNRRIGEYRLPEKVVVAAAGNRETDKAVTHRMPSALANRFVHFELKVSYDDWQSWAMANKVHPAVIGFLGSHKEKLFDFDPKSADKAFPTPRSWVYVSDLLIDDDENVGSGGRDERDFMNKVLIAGAVGNGAAHDFISHLRVNFDLPDPNKVLRGEVKKLDVPSTSARYSLSVNLCYTLKEKQDEILEENADPGKDDEFQSMINNLFKFTMDNYTDQKELVILTLRIAFLEYGIKMDRNKIPEFKNFMKHYGKLVLPS